MSLIGFELKKIGKSPLNWVALFVMAVLIVILLTVNLLDSPPRHYLEAQRGLITSEKIDRVIGKNAEITSNPLNFEHGVMKASIYEKEWKSFSKFEKYISATYKVKSGSGVEAGKDVIDYLEPGMGAFFYKERLARVEDQLSGNVGEGLGTGYSRTSSTLLLGMQNQLETPFLFDYHDGWQMAMGLLRLVVIIVGAAVAVCITPIFTYDYQCGMDQLIYTSLHGKTKLFFAKYFAGLAFLTLVFGLTIMIYSAVIFAIYGTGGYSAPFQLLQWMSPYALNMTQAYLLCILMGYLSCLLFVSFVMLLAVQLKNMQMTMVFSWLALLMPLFINTTLGGRRHLYGFVLDMMPINIMDGFNILGTQGIYEVFGIAILQPYMQITASVLLSIGFVTMTARIYKGHRVKGIMEVKS